MHPQLETLFDDAESRYLKPEELQLISQYVDSLPERLEVYRLLRDQELDLMQSVADRLQAELPQEPQATLERSIKNALLMLRYCAMSLLLNDETFVRDRFLSWVSQTVEVYNSQSVDVKLYRLLNQRLSQMLTPRQINLLAPMLTMAQKALAQPNGTAIG